MMTVHEVSELTGVSIRTLHYYDQIGLLPPARSTEAGYRLYDEAALERLQQILLFRELEFPLKEIRRIVGSPGFDKKKALAQQLGLLRLKKEHIERLIALAEGLQRAEPGERPEFGERRRDRMDFTAFDKSKMEEYARQAKAAWGDTDAYREYETRTAGMTMAEQQRAGTEMMEIFRAFGAIKEDGKEPSGEEARALVRKLQDFISANYYTCTKEILAGLGQMYAAGGAFTENIDQAGGAGTAAFTAQAIREYCR